MVLVPSALTSICVVLPVTSALMNLLSNTLHTFRAVQGNELDLYRSELKALKLDFDEHLRTNPNSEIIGELNRINALCSLPPIFQV
jgi:hypothetical protein